MGLWLRYVIIYKYLQLGLSTHERAKREIAVFTHAHYRFAHEFVIFSRFVLLNNVAARLSGFTVSSYLCTIAIKGNGPSRISAQPAHELRASCAGFFAEFYYLSLFASYKAKVARQREAS